MPVDSYIVPLKRAYDKPRTRRSNVAVKEIFDFLYKHTRKKKESIVLSKEVNEYVWKRGIQKPPRKIAISLREDKGKIYVFLKDSKEIENFLNRDKQVEKKQSIKEKVLEMKESMQNPKTDKSKKEDLVDEKDKVVLKKAEDSKDYKVKETDDSKTEDTTNKTETDKDLKEDTKMKKVDLEKEESIEKKDSKPKLEKIEM